VKFVIFSPYQTGGGPIVLHNLCKNLTGLGYDAKIFNCDTIWWNDRKSLKFWIKWFIFVLKDSAQFVLSKVFHSKKLSPGYVDVPVRGCKRKILPFVDDQTIVVYPELICGNFLNAKHVVRWFLYHNRYKDNPDAYGKDDLFICYREIFNDNELNPQKLRVATPYFDLDTYKQTNFGERKGTCYIVRKGANRPDLPKTFDGIVVDYLSEKEKVKVFNQCEYCVSYDTQTAYSKIAALCGCISVIVPEEGKAKTDYRGAGDSIIGRAWGFSTDEIEYAKKTRHLIREQYHATNARSMEETKEFVRICEDCFAQRTAEME